MEEFQAIALLKQKNLAGLEPLIERYHLQAIRTSYLILSHVPFNELGLPDLPETPINLVSERTVGLTLPVALGWGAALTAVAAGMHLVNQRQAKKIQAEAGKEESHES